jgi:putative lipoprotein (rSAM/lipoprotein system)
MKQFFTIFAVVLIFGGCMMKSPMPEPSPVKYGIYGNVTSSTTGRYIENIKVVMYEIVQNVTDAEIACDSVFTDKGGYFKVTNSNATPYFSNNYRLYFSDKSGFYRDTTISVTFIDEIFNEGNHNETSMQFDVSLNENEIIN